MAVAMGDSTFEARRNTQTTDEEEK